MSFKDTLSSKNDLGVKKDEPTNPPNTGRKEVVIEVSKKIYHYHYDSSLSDSKFPMDVDDTNNKEREEKNNNNENHHAMISYIYNELRDIAYLLKISNSEWNLYLIFDNYELGFVFFCFFGISI